jgi:aspartate--ammonia ligase, AsnA-type
MPIQIPKNYQSDSNQLETNIKIKMIKDYFENQLSKTLNLTRVSAPLVVYHDTGLNDNLSGVERPVRFDVKASGKDAEIVHSLAKWKRYSLFRYGLKNQQGLYTDMNAIRRDEELDNIHSIYVDQWDWEVVISNNQRNIETLKIIVNDIYNVFKETESFVVAEVESIEPRLPEKIYFITAQELEDLYPNLSPKERENKICQQKEAVFIIGIGHYLNSGLKHDERSPDYDDWLLNGDLLVWNPVLNDALELSSMGIRVNSEILMQQLTLSNCEYRIDYPFHQRVLNNQLPQSIGGGIGQSRMCMYFLRKAHIGEVQASLWDQETIEVCKEKEIYLL